ncbi:hypothetical protein BJ546DRAFT_853964 [Cryomyces antarcticus]
MAATNGNGPMPVPHHRMGSGQAMHMRNGGFEGPRSPPGGKNTSHVPCKFFRHGACQAGKACPFSHSTEPVTEIAPCKYFTRGNCKFGAKCALVHILPDGRRMNRPAMSMGGGHLNLGGRVHPHQLDQPPTSSLLTMQANMAPPQLTPAYAYSVQEEYLAGPPPPKPIPPPNPQYDTIPTIDTNFSSYHNYSYGSPPNDSRQPTSPIQNGLSVLDAPLPASFDSQGISHIARYGAIAASVPSRFGVESPPSSLPNKSTLNSNTFRNLQDSAFDDENRANKALSGLRSSPPVASEESFARHTMHSERFARPKIVSASLGAQPPLGVADDWDDGYGEFGFEEDLVPTALHDLLTPQEKMRRFSRSAGDDEAGHGGTNGINARASLSGLSTPQDSKVGSPHSSSPSRFGALFARTHARTDEHSASPFGHVGSPLRNSSFHLSASPSQRPISRPSSVDASPFVASPPRQSSMSMISQQLQRTRLGERVASSEASSSSSNLRPGAARNASNGSVSSAPGSGINGRMENVPRVISSSSVGRDKIDEEQGLFSMEEEEEEKTTRLNKADPAVNGAAGAAAGPRRFSGNSPWNTGTSASTLGPIGGQREGGRGGVWGGGA